MRVRIAIVDSNAAFTRAISTVLLAAVRVSMWASNATAVVELDFGLGVGSPIAQISEAGMVQGCGRWDWWGL